MRSSQHKYGKCDLRSHFVWHGHLVLFARHRYCFPCLGAAAEDQLAPVLLANRLVRYFASECTPRVKAMCLLCTGSGGKEGCASAVETVMERDGAFVALV